MVASGHAMDTPPVITPQQMNLLRAVTAMAWSDGVLEPAEIDVMATNLSQRFASDPDQQAALTDQLKDYFNQQIPLAEVIPKLKDEAERRLVLKLGYQVIAASARTPGEPLVNMAEQAAFQTLVQTLNLAPEIVHQVSEEAHAELGDQDVEPLEALIEGFTQHYQSGSR